MISELDVWNGSLLIDDRDDAEFGLVGAALAFFGPRHDRQPYERLVHLTFARLWLAKLCKDGAVVEALASRAAVGRDAAPVDAHDGGAPWLSDERRLGARRRRRVERRTGAAATRRLLDDHPSRRHGRPHDGRLQLPRGSESCFRSNHK